MHGSNLKGWLFVVGLGLLFVCWGLFLFFTIGDKGPPSWDFGLVRDVPGESPYSTRGPLTLEEARPQHVDRQK